MQKVYACLAGNWVCLNDDPDSKIGGEMKSPYEWVEEGAVVYAPISRTEKQADSYYYLDYVNIHYFGVDYRINPIFIQIAVDSQ